MGNGRRKNGLCGDWLGSIPYQLPQFHGHAFQSPFDQTGLPFGRADGSFLKDILDFDGLSPIGSRKPSQEQIRDNAGFVHLE